MGRKYGKLQYGAYTYDKMQAPWLPVVGGENEIWVPLPTTWPPPPEKWASAITVPVEIWIPIRPPLTG